MPAPTRFRDWVYLVLDVTLGTLFRWLKGWLTLCTSR